VLVWERLSRGTPVYTIQPARSPSTFLLALACAVAAIGAAGPGPAVTAPGAGGPSAGAVRTAEAADIQHIAPRPNFVGAPPQRFEWSATPGADNYTFGLWTEFDVMLVEMPNIHATAVTWPKDVPPLDPGTYYWSVAAFDGKTGIATSGLAAFVVVK
jgi:hypothetical protein